MKYHLILLTCWVTTFAFAAAHKEIQGALEKCLTVAGDDTLEQLFKYIKRVPPREGAKTVCRPQSDTAVTCARKYEGDAGAEAAFGLRSGAQGVFFLHFSDEVDNPPDAEGPFGYSIRFEATSIPSLNFTKLKKADIDDLGEETNVSFTYEEVTVVPGAEKSEFFTSYGDKNRTQLIFPSKKYERCLKEELPQ